MRAVLDRVLRRRSRPLPDRWRRPLLAVTVGGLCVAVVWAWRRSGLRWADLEVLPLLGLLLVAAPASLALKAAEFTVAARIAGNRPTRHQAVDTAVVSAAANLLPLPGSLLVTVQVIAADGAGYGRAVRASAVPGVAWLGITGLIGGTAIVVAGSTVLGAVIAAAGVCALVAASVLFSTTIVGPRTRLAAMVLIVEGAWLAVSALRFTLAAAALGIGLDVSQALALSVAGAVTVAVGFVPGGLGVREALIAGLAPTIGLDVETGILLGAIDRVVWLAFLAVAAAIVSVRRGQRSDATSSAKASP